MKICWIVSTGTVNNLAPNMVFTETSTLLEWLDNFANIVCKEELKEEPYSIWQDFIRDITTEAQKDSLVWTATYQHVKTGTIIHITWTELRGAKW